MARLKTTRAESSGGVVLRGHPGALEVALVGRTEPGTWALPKGTPNPMNRANRRRYGRLAKKLAWMPALSSRSTASPTGSSCGTYACAKRYTTT